MKRLSFKLGITFALTISIVCIICYIAFNSPVPLYVAIASCLILLFVSDLPTDFISEIDDIDKYKRWYTEEDIENAVKYGYDAKRRGDTDRQTWINYKIFKGIL
jgi:hypothetical protein